MNSISPILNIMIKACEKASKVIIRDFGEIENLQVKKKGPKDFVTKTDKRVEKILVEELEKSKKNYSFITEETGIIKKSDADNFWIIDPIDGTTNFLHGIPHFAISIALKSKNEIISGLIFDPIKNEMFYAEKNAGSFFNNRRIRVSKKVELEDSVEPIDSEIFRLYYISPAQAKTTINELFKASEGGDSVIQITEEVTTRSIIVRGKSEDLDVVDKIITEIDVRTKQVLIEAFIVEADSDFERALGTRLGGAYQKNQESVGGIAGGTTANSAIGTTSGALGGNADSLTDFTATAAGATSGIGILKRTGSAVLKAEIQALESLGLGKTISNPKVFTLDNQVASIIQGEEIQFQATGSEGANTSFKEAVLKLTVTPSIIGDGNVLLDVTVNNDSVNRATAGEPGINKMEIATKLLIADGDIVVIGGIKKNKVFNTKENVPGLGNVPVLGNLFKGTKKSDSMDELLIFIAPRVL